MQLINYICNAKFGKGKYVDATYTKCNENAVKAYLPMPTHGYSSLRGGSSSLNSPSLFSSEMFIGLGDDEA